MIQSYKGHYHYNKKVVSDWNSTAIGVYYCGYPLTNGKLYVLYVGKATSNEGIRGRLLQHLRENKWSNVSHFGYCVCSTSKESENFEASEIKRLKPKHNKQGKSYS